MASNQKTDIPFETAKGRDAATQERYKYDTFCIHLQRAARLWRREANSDFRDFRLSESLTTPIWTLSKFGGMRQRDLADHIGVEGNSLVRILDELVEEGLVVRREDPKDRRAKIVELTPQGQKVSGEVELVSRGLRASLLSNVSEDDIRTTFRVLVAIIEEADRRAGLDSDG